MKYELYARGRKDTGDNYMLGHEWLRTDKKRTLRPSGGNGQEHLL